MKFVIDANLPVEVVDWLNSIGHDSVHVSMLGIENNDGLIWSYAIGTGSVVVTKDSDFADWVRERSPAPRLVWLRTGNLRKKQQLEHLARGWLQVLTRLTEGEQVVEVR